MFAQFIRLCLNKDPQLRPTAAELMKHPFLTKAPPPKYLVSHIETYTIKELQARSKEGILIYCLLSSDPPVKPYQYTASY
jgi:serine/threonine protein kinase